jgi:putative membrane protein
VTYAMEEAGVYPSWMVARALVQGLNTRSAAGTVLQAAIAALTLTGWDVVMGPAMSTIGRNWVWENGGAFYGVPRHNYLGWLTTTFFVYLIAGYLWKVTDRKYLEGRWFPLLPVLVYALFAVRYVAYNDYVALQMVAIFTMGLPSLLAIARALLAAESGRKSDIDPRVDHESALPI